MTWPFGIFAREYAKRLERELEFWKLQWRNERQRAERLTDVVLASKGFAPIASPVRREETTLPTTEELIADAMQTQDFADVGQDR